MERALVCTECGAHVNSLLDQVLDLQSVSICQCPCGEVVVLARATADIRSRHARPWQIEAPELDA